MDYRRTKWETLFPGSKILVCFMDQHTWDASFDDSLEGHRVNTDVGSMDMSKILGPLEASFGSPLPKYRAYATNWYEDKSALGSWETWEFKGNPFTLDQYYEFYHPRNDNLIFGGSASCNRYFGFTHGAYYGGIRAAKWAIACLDDPIGGCDEIPYSPCDDENGIQNTEFDG